MYPSSLICGLKLFAKVYGFYLGILRHKWSSQVGVHVRSKACQSLISYHFSPFTVDKFKYLITVATRFHTIGRSISACVIKLTITAHKIPNRHVRPSSIWVRYTRSL